MSRLRARLERAWESLFPAPLDLGLRAPVPAAEVEATVERVKVRECRSDRPVLYDQEAPLASEVEAWLAGGAR